MTKRLYSLFLALVAIAVAATAQQSDFGLSASAGIDYKINKKWSLGVEGEYRSRNDFRTTDQWAISLEAAYKPLKWLKISAGYEFKYCNFIEKINLHADGSLNNWRPSYYQGVHRALLSATGSLSLGRFGLSLRERYQYTYRPSTTRQRYDFDDHEWSDKIISAKHKNVLRSRLKADYNIRKSKVDPFASVEFFNALSLEKVRYTVGAEWKIRKTHVIDVFYRYQDSHTSASADGNDINEHLIGVGYTFKL